MVITPANGIRTSQGAATPSVPLRLPLAEATKLIELRLARPGAILPPGAASALGN